VVTAAGLAKNALEIEKLLFHTIHNAAPFCGIAIHCGSA
jgi:hypothetical protein